MFGAASTVISSTASSGPVPVRPDFSVSFLFWQGQFSHLLQPRFGCGKSRRCARDARARHLQRGALFFLLHRRINPPRLLQRARARARAYHTIMAKWNRHKRAERRDSHIDDRCSALMATSGFAALTNGGIDEQRLQDDITHASRRQKMRRPAIFHATPRASGRQAEQAEAARRSCLGSASSTSC